MAVFENIDIAMNKAAFKENTEILLLGSICASQLELERAGMKSNLMFISKFNGGMRLMITKTYLCFSIKIILIINDRVLT